MQALDLLVGGPPVSAAVSTSRKQQRSIRDFFTSPPILPSAKRLKTQAPAGQASAASPSGQQATTADHDSAAHASAAHDAASHASAAHAAAAQDSAAHDSVACAAATEGLPGHESADGSSATQQSVEQLSEKQGTDRQMGCPKSQRSVVVVAAQPASVLQNVLMPHSQGCPAERQNQQGQKGADSPLRGQSQELGGSIRAGLTQQGFEDVSAAQVFVKLDATVDSHTHGSLGSDGDKENRF